MNEETRKATPGSEIRAPGVYVTETPGSRRIEGVRTDVAAFVGYTEKAEGVGGPEGSAIRLARIGSLGEYERAFGGAVEEELAVSITEAATPVVAFSGTPPDVPRFLLPYAVRMFFANDGEACWIVSVGRHGVDGAGMEVREEELAAGIRALAGCPEPTLVVVPDACALDPDAFGRTMDGALERSVARPGRFTIVDVPRAVSGGSESDDHITRHLRNRLFSGPSLRGHGAAYFPYVRTSIPLHCSDRSITVVQPRSRGARGRAPASSRRARPLERLRRSNPRAYAAVRDFLGRAFATLPPSGAVAGAVARVDRSRGVWKAPANVSLREVTAPALAVTAALNERMNAHPSGMAVNAIRVFPGKGTLVWGARTLATSDPDLRYVPVRRMLVFLESSIRDGLEWAVFEPNSPNTWAAVRASVEGFLQDLWRNGAFAGERADDAYFVKVGLGDTMTETDVAEGLLKVQIGVAALRPAEFIVLKVQRRFRRPDDPDDEGEN